MDKYTKYNSCYFGFLIIVVGGAFYVSDKILGILVILGGVLLIVGDIIYLTTRGIKMKREYISRQKYLQIINRETLQKPIPENEKKLIETPFREIIHNKDLDLNEELTNIKIEISNQMRKESERISRKLETMIISLLKSNSGNAFTLMSLIKRLKGDTLDLNTLEYLEKNGEGFLNSLIYDKKIKSTRRNNEVFYFIKAETLQKPIPEKKKKIIEAPFHEFIHTKRIEICPSCFSVYDENTETCDKCGISLEKIEEGK